MIQITKKEAEYLRTHNRGDYVHMTSKSHKSSAKKYYIVENNKNMELLKEYRQSINMSD